MWRLRPRGPPLARPLAIEHQGHVADRVEHEAQNEAAKPPIDGLPGRKILRQHAPAPARAGQIADRVQNLAQFRLSRTPAYRKARQEPLYPRPLLLRQIRRVALGLLLNLGATGL